MIKSRWLNEIDVLEVVILITIYLIKFVNKTEYLNPSVFNMITEINESKTLAEYISCGCKFRFDEENM